MPEPRIILSTTNEGDLVVDPFCGSGTVGKVAVELGRRFIGIDISKAYCEIAEERISEIETNLTSNSLYNKLNKRR
jgi:site-specific DNA-methyltransferase (adenine-specific)